jgi:hypothetical protein
MSLGLAVGLGAMFGPLGIGLCTAIIMLPIYSQKIERMRPAMHAVRNRLGLGSSLASSDISTD